MPETVKQGYLEIREVATREVVTAIELLSPVNKRSGEGRKIYETRILASRSARRPQADLYAFNLQQEIPLFPIPLKLGDTEPLVDLHQLINTVYDRGGYDLEIDYARQSVSPLPEMDAAWADTLLRGQGLR